MIKIENGYCEIKGSLNTLKYYGDSDLLNGMTDVLKEELEECNEQY